MEPPLGREEASTTFGSDRFIVRFSEVIAERARTTWYSGDDFASSMAACTDASSFTWTRDEVTVCEKDCVTGLIGDVLEPVTSEDVRTAIGTTSDASTAGPADNVPADFKDGATSESATFWDLWVVGAVG